MKISAIEREPSFLDDTKNKHPAPPGEQSKSLRMHGRIRPVDRKRESEGCGHLSETESMADGGWMLCQLSSIQGDNEPLLNSMATGREFLQLRDREGLRQDGVWCQTRKTNHASHDISPKVAMIK